jgi:hypothetical protein
MWLRALNQWVVRVENLKKYQVLSQIGTGGQAKVYKIARRNGSIVNADQRSSSNVIPAAAIKEGAAGVLAIKVVNKDRLIQKSLYEKR